MKPTEKTRGLDLLYLQHVSPNPHKDREKIIQHCKDVLANPLAKKFGDPNAFCVDEIDSCLANATFSKSYSANYKDATLTAWDQLILASKRFVVNFFDDAIRAKRDNIQRYKNVIKKISCEYGIDYTTKAGKKEFLTVLEQELAVRIHWFIKKDKTHSVSSFTALVPTGLNGRDQSKKFFLNVLLAKREDIYSYLGSQYRDSISSMFKRKGEIPNVKNLDDVISFLTMYANNILKVEPKQLISSIAGMNAGRREPDLKKVDDFLNVIKNFCENSLHTNDPSEIMAVISSITGMCNGQGIPTKEELERFLNEIKDFCEVSLSIHDPSKIIDVISSVTAICGGHGIPEKGKAKNYLNEICSFCKKTLCMQNPTEIVEFIKASSSMLHCRGIPKAGTMTIFLTSIIDCPKKEINNKDPQKMARILRQIMRKQSGKGFADMERSKALKTTAKEVSSEEKKKLSIELFNEHEGYISTITKYLPVLKDIWDVKSNKISEKHRERIMVRDFAIKISEDLEQILTCSKINNEAQISIISAAKKYLTCRDEIIRLHGGLVGYCMGELDRPANVDFYDFMSTGEDALIDAVDRFDPRHQCVFSTYACNYITGKLLNYLKSENSMLHMPNSVGAIIVKIKRMLSTQKTTTGLEDIDKVAAELNLDRSTVVHLLSVSGDAVKVSELKRSEESNHDDFFIDSRKNPSKLAEQGDFRNFIKTTLLKRLNEREYTVLMDYFGFAGERFTLDEIGKKQNPPISRERVRQIVDAALEKVRYVVSHNPRLARECNAFFSE